MKVGIVGYGTVGQKMLKLFVDAVIYDAPKHIGTKESINLCDTVFVCVPTSNGADGLCDTSIVEEVISWLNVPLIIIRSTVKVGFTLSMIEKYHKEIVFQPEYIGETVNHPITNNPNQWLTFGGTTNGKRLAVKTYQKIINADTKIYLTDPSTAELAKYMTNAFLATKVSFCNEMYDIAEKLNINYDELREIWLADPRIGRSHTFVYEDNRGFGGNCLPKDIQSIAKQADELGLDATILNAVIEKNNKLKRNS